MVVIAADGVVVAVAGGEVFGRFATVTIWVVHGKAVEHEVDERGVLAFRIGEWALYADGELVVVIHPVLIRMATAGIEGLQANRVALGVVLVEEGNTVGGNPNRAEGESDSS